MHAVLQDCTDAFLPAEKQLHYFDRNHTKGEAWYRSLFAAAPAGAVKGECTPDYIGDTDALDRMADLVPDTKVVLVYRDPVERAYSHYKVRRRAGRIPDTLSFEDCFADDPFLLRNSSYGDHLERLLARFPAQNILIVGFDAMIEQPHEFLEELCGFLGINHAVPPGYVLDQKFSESLPPVTNLRQEAIMLAVRRMVQPVMLHLVPQSAYRAIQQTFTRLRRRNSLSDDADMQVPAAATATLEASMKRFHEALHKHAVRRWPSGPWTEWNSAPGHVTTTNSVLETHDQV